MGIFAGTPGQPAKGPDPNFVQASIPRVVTFKFKDVLLGGVFYLEPADILNFTVASRLTNEVVTFSYRFITIDGNVVVGQDKVAAGPAFGFNQISRTLGEGFLTSISASPSIATMRGDTFCGAFLSRGSSSLGVGTYGLLGDYATNQEGINWPGGVIRPQPEGMGAAISLTQANPGLGADWTFTVPTGQRIKVKSIKATLTTSGVAGNRNVEVSVVQGGNQVWLGVANAAIASGAIAAVNFVSVNFTSIILPAVVFVGLPPDLNLSGGATISTITNGILGGDQWSSIALLVESFVENL